MGLLIHNTPVEAMAGAFAQRITRVGEALIDRAAPTLGAPLTGAARANAAKAGPLFLSSGYSGSVLGLQPILRSAARDGIPAHGFGIGDGGLAPLADAVRAFDELITSQAPAGPIHLAGHSKGGMVVQEWYRTAPEAQRSRVASMTLVSSPPRGVRIPEYLQPMTWVAQKFGGPFSTIVNEVASTTPLMRRISELEVPSHTRAASIVSVEDELVSVGDARWPGANNVVITGPGAPRHLETLGDSRTYEAMRANVLDLPAE